MQKNDHDTIGPGPSNEEKQEVEDQIFRAEALENIAAPEDLNTLFKPATFRKKTLNITMGVFFLALLLWLFFGSLPLTIDGRGIIMNRKGLFTIEAKADGIVKQIFVKQGNFVDKGQLVMRLSDPEEEKKYDASLIKVKNLENDVAQLQEQIQKELLAQRESIQQQILAAEASITDLEASIVQLKKELELKEKLYEQHLIGLNDVHETKQLLSQRMIAVEMTKGTLATLEASLTKSYREQELLGKKRDLLQAKQQSELLKLSMHYLDVISPNSGTVLEVLSNYGERTTTGSPLIRLEYGKADKQNYLFYAYIPAEYGKQVRTGIQVEVELSTVRAEEYGAILGNVIEVSSYPVSREYIGNIIQNEGLVDYLIDGNKAVTQIVIEPILDPATPSGFKWTSGKGPPIKISTGTVCLVKGIVGREAPVFYLFSLWRIERFEQEVENYFHPLKSD